MRNRVFLNVLLKLLKKWKALKKKLPKSVGRKT